MRQYLFKSIMHLSPVFARFLFVFNLVQLSPGPSPGLVSNGDRSSSRGWRTPTNQMINNPFSKLHAPVKPSSSFLYRNTHKRYVAGEIIYESHGLICSWSYVEILKRKGAMTDPCDTPTPIAHQLNKKFPVTTNIFAEYICGFFSLEFTDPCNCLGGKLRRRNGYRCSNVLCI